MSFFDVPARDVGRFFLPVGELGEAVQQKKVAAVLAIGPVAPGEVVDVVEAIAHATNGTPGILGLDEADTIGKRFPGFESIDVPAGAFRARPATPSDTVTTLAVSLAGSLFAAATTYWSRRQSEADWRPIKRLVEIADEAPRADTSGLAALDEEFHRLVSAVLGTSPGGGDADRMSAFSTALAHARHALDQRRASLTQEPELRPATTLVAAQ